MVYDVRIRQGRLGRWRWMVYDADGAFIAVSGVQGYETATQCREAARHLFDSKVHIGLAEHYEARGA